MPEQSHTFARSHRQADPMDELRGSCTHPEVVEHERVSH